MAAAVKARTNGGVGLKVIDGPRGFKMTIILRMTARLLAAKSLLSDSPGDS
jgi:hypothetical protein